MRFTLQAEDHWRGRWHPIAQPAVFEADTPAHALSLVSDRGIGLRAGVRWRIHITGPGIDVYSVEATSPAVPRDVGRIMPEPSVPFISTLTDLPPRERQLGAVMGRLAFNGYRASMDGRTHDGREIPPWEALSTPVHCAWITAATWVAAATVDTVPPDEVADWLRDVEPVSEAALRG